MRTRTSTKTCPGCGSIPIIVGGGPRGKRYYRCGCGARLKDTPDGGLGPVNLRTPPVAKPAELKVIHPEPVEQVQALGQAEVVFMTADEFEHQYEPRAREVQTKRAARHK